MSRNRVLISALLLLAAASCAPRPKSPSVYVLSDASRLERLAASEIRRYLYLTTGELPEIVTVASLAAVKSDGVIVIRRTRLPGPGDPAAAVFEGYAAETFPRLEAEDYCLKTVHKGRRTYVLAVGGDGPGVLYAAYALAEKFGVRFYLDGDVVPDERVSIRLPDLDETSRPLFALRGIQPFHDFAEGPDWWNEDDYKAVLGQLPKLRMNFFGLHTYPEGNPNAEPLVWIGTAEDFRPDGRVAFSYPSSWQNTLRANPGSHNWGYRPKPTGRFRMGAANLFERDGYGAEVMSGLMPEPASAEDANELFNRTAAMLRGAFTLARGLGVRTCVGTETPLTVPALVRERLKKLGRDAGKPEVVREIYGGMFRRLAAAFPVDYYWFWTTESWTWSDATPAAIKAVTTDLEMAVRAAADVAAPFSLATCGWVLGPPSDRTLFDESLPKTMAVSCINREVGKAPVDPAFARIAGRSKWVIPWLEDDPSLTSPQLWAGRMRRDAVDARRFGCDGLLGIHWRTRILSPNILALARAGWDQSWNTLPVNFADLVGPVNGRFVRAPQGTMTTAGPEAVYADVRDRVSSYRLLVPAGRYDVTLKFCETEFDRKGARVFDVLIQGRKTAEAVDIFDRAGRFKPLDIVVRKVEVEDGRLVVDFGDRIHYPSLAGLVVEGTTAAGTAFVQKINCGGPQIADYIADWPETPRGLPVEDLYLDWARNQFGRGADAEIAALFAGLDGRLPIAVNWTDGPGGIRPDARPWSEVARAYAYVDELAALRPRIQGAGALERFDYWLENFEIMRETARFQCLWAEYDAALIKVKAEKDPGARRTAALEKLVPKRTEMIKPLRAIWSNLLSTVSNPGELGTIANWEQHLLPPAFETPGEELVGLLGGPLPAYADLPLTYEGPARILVPTARTSVEAGAEPAIKAVVLASSPVASVVLHWRPLGRGEFAAAPLALVARGVYKGVLPPMSQDIEYYVEARADDRDIRFPVTAPTLNHTVVVIPAEKK
ncbi:MAG: malectin domain-containing carbohydrate-binding protein [Acidobacteriota bacterium]|nr:malectin domain-containing carbohydrate-binding protein [Acidobacteriota bacterium]